MIKKINFVLVIGMLLGTLYYVLFEYDSSRFLTYLAVFPVIFAPFLLTRTKYHLKDRELFVYYVFVFLADFLGCVVNLYNMISWYDLFTHFLSGIFTFGIGFFILDKVGIRGKNFFFDLFFGLCVVMLVAGMWEFFEYGADCFLGMDLQHNLDTGVADTMEDMLAAFLGGIGTGVGYLVMRNR